VKNPITKRTRMIGNIRHAVTDYNVRSPRLTLAICDRQLHLLMTIKVQMQQSSSSPTVKVYENFHDDVHSGVNHPETGQQSILRHSHKSSTSCILDKFTVQCTVLYVVQYRRYIW